MKLLVTGVFPLRPEERAWLEAAGYEITLHQDERQPVAHPEQFGAVICSSLFLFQPIEVFSNLKCIQLISAGLDRVPLEYIRTHGIALYNAAGVYTVPMAEFAVCGILEFYKQSRFFARNQAEHRWQKHRGLQELAGRQVCILGCGGVGKEIARRLRAFGCSLTGVNRTVRPLPEFDRVLPLTALPEVIAGCDILVCCIALTPETRGILGTDIFARLSPDAVFVNVARGPLTDEAALTAWLQSGGRAVLDVFEQEPLPETSPLWDMENVILTPHNSFVGEGNHERMWKRIQEILLPEQKG